MSVQPLFQLRYDVLMVLWGKALAFGFVGIAGSLFLRVSGGQDRSVSVQEVVLCSSQAGLPSEALSPQRRVLSPPKNF